MTVGVALLWFGALAVLIVIARRLGFRSRRVSYPFGFAVAALIFLVGALTDVGAEVVPLGYGSQRGPARRSGDTYDRGCVSILILVLRAGDLAVGVAIAVVVVVVIIIIVVVGAGTDGRGADRGSAPPGGAPGTVSVDGPARGSARDRPALDRAISVATPGNADAAAIAAADADRTAAYTDCAAAGAPTTAATEGERVIDEGRADESRSRQGYE
jgi:hypothetical protein